MALLRSPSRTRMCRRHAQAIRNVSRTWRTTWQLWNRFVHLRGSPNRCVQRSMVPSRWLTPVGSGFWRIFADDKSCFPRLIFQWQLSRIFETGSRRSHPSSTLSALPSSMRRWRARAWTWRRGPTGKNHMYPSRGWTKTWRQKTKTRRNSYKATRAPCSTSWAWMTWGSSASSTCAALASAIRGWSRRQSCGRSVVWTRQWSKTTAIGSPFT